MGDVDPNEVARLAAQYFTPIPAGPAPERVPTVEPEQLGERRVTLVDRSQPYVVMGFHRPAGSDADAPVYTVLADILDAGRTSRFYRGLVETQRAVGTNVLDAFPGTKYPSLFTVIAVPAPGVSPGSVEADVTALLDRVAADGVTEEELARAKTRARAGLVASLQSSDGLAAALAEAEALRGDWRALFPRHRRAGPRLHGRRAARRRGDVPDGEPDRRDAQNSGVGHGARGKRHGETDGVSLPRAACPLMPHAPSLMPSPMTARLLVPAALLVSGCASFGSPARRRAGRPRIGIDARTLRFPDLPEVAPPAVRRAELSNGLVVFLAEDHTLPLVQARARIGAGSAQDPATEVGLADIAAAAMRSGGAGTLDADALNLALESVGATVEGGRRARRLGRLDGVAHGDAGHRAPALRRRRRTPALRRRAGGPGKGAAGRRHRPPQRRPRRHRAARLRAGDVRRGQPLRPHARALDRRRRLAR